jgi:serpin B
LEEANVKSAILIGLAALLFVGSLVSAADTPPAVIARPESKVVKDNNTFALDLYAQLAGEKDNLFFSPFSISTALAMTYAGARGQTATEMAQTLHFPLNQQELHPAFARLLKEMNGKNNKGSLELHLANALWGQKGYGFRNEFLEVTKANYGAGLREVGFVQAADEARQTINRWVEEQTQNKIKDLIQPGILTPMTRLVLTNAIYFKAAWQYPFSEYATKQEEFQVTPDKKVPVPMMHQVKGFNYLDGGTFQLLEMPYQGRQQSMLVFLPKTGDGLAEFEKTLTAKNLESWLGKCSTQQVTVAFPKFKFTRAFELNKTLSAMGMPLAFSDRADFSGMDGRKDLYISNVIHKAFVDVHEKGTEAAAATAVVVATKSAPPAPKHEFRADHPFVFVIRDHRTGSILFLGRVTNPQA